MAALTALTADAAPKQARPAQPQEATAPRDAGEPIMAIVSIKSQQVVFYDADGWILRAPVSTGTEGRETPAGVFAVVDKEVDHRSNMYDDAWMPHMQRITWNGIALHGGPLPGYAASHGCVRMPFGFADKLFNKTRIGMRVIIAPDDPTPVDFFPSGASRPEGGSHRGCAGAGRDARPRGRGGHKGGRRGKASCRASGARDGIAYGIAAQADIAQGPRRCRTRGRRQGARGRKNGPGEGAGRDAEAEGRFRVEQRGSSSTPPRPTRSRSRCRRCKERREGGRGQENRHRQAALDAKLALVPVLINQPRHAEALRAAQHAQTVAGRGRVFDFGIEVPVTIHNPHKPIGTHVFTAMARNDAACAGPQSRSTTDEAKNALDRITIPQDVLDLIAQTTLPRSSIIVSDEPLSSETTIAPNLSRC